MNIKLSVILTTLVLSTLVSFAGVEKTDDGIYLFRGLVSYFPATNTLAYTGKPEDIVPYKSVLFKPTCMTDERLETCARSEVELLCEGRESGAMLVLTRVIEVKSVGDAQWVRQQPESP